MARRDFPDIVKAIVRVLYRDVSDGEARIVPITQYMRELDVSPNTFYRAIKCLQESEAVVKGEKCYHFDIEGYMEDRDVILALKKKIGAEKLKHFVDAE
ncbi:MAG: hypothetical protein M0R66_07625 [Candidatus Omnitrophica bacterium]|nr:hypothetical protein [Candidatus Omnitrophota bacterium]